MIIKILCKKPTLQQSTYITSRTTFTWVFWVRRLSRPNKCPISCLSLEANPFGYSNPPKISKSVVTAMLVYVLWDKSTVHSMLIIAIIVFFTFSSAPSVIDNLDVFVSKLASLGLPLQQQLNPV